MGVLISKTYCYISEMFSPLPVNTNSLYTPPNRLDSAKLSTSPSTVSRTSFPATAFSDLPTGGALLCRPLPCLFLYFTVYFSKSITYFMPKTSCITKYQAYTVRDYTFIFTHRRMFFSQGVLYFL